MPGKRLRSTASSMTIAGQLAFQPTRMGLYIWTGQPMGCSYSAEKQAHLVLRNPQGTGREDSRGLCVR